jgi:gas vesicle protein
VMLLSPTSGSEARRTLKRRAAGLEDRAADALKDVERRAEDTVSEALRTAREAATSKRS